MRHQSQPMGSRLHATDLQRAAAADREEDGDKFR